MRLLFLIAMCGYVGGVRCSGPDAYLSELPRFCTVSLDVSYVDKRKTGPCGVATFAINAGIDPVLNVLG